MSYGRKNRVKEFKGDHMPNQTPQKSCCEPTCCEATKTESSSTITQAVRERYGATAESSLSTNDAGVKAVAEAFGYSDAELMSIPAEANMGLSCGNPTATANLKTGEIVVDLGSGGGLDVFLAAEKVGPSGKAIGIDMTEAMIERARRNAGRYTNVEFYLSTIDRIPLADESVDVVISNCVINLAPDKDAVFREIARVLKPGGRVAVSDIALKKALPQEFADSVAAYIGCIAGAIPIESYRAGLNRAGFSGVIVTDAGSDLNAYAKVEGQAACCSPAAPSVASLSGLPIAQSCCTPSSKADVHGGLSELIKKYDVNEFAASVRVFAVKP
jgi:arsenite methyltransferase